MGLGGPVCWTIVVSEGSNLILLTVNLMVWFSECDYLWVGCQQFPSLQGQGLHLYQSLCIPRLKRCSVGHFGCQRCSGVMSTAWMGASEAFQRPSALDVSGESVMGS
jgi:hypothetical protein